MFETSILVLLYNKEISSSKTITSLIESPLQYLNARLVIWNNGPVQLKNRDTAFLENLGYNVVIEETLNNESLAVIYNKFIAKNVAEKFILLDDDSVLNVDYISASSKSKATDVAMPIISSQGKVQYPQIDKQLYFKGIRFDLNSKVITVGSGLVVGAAIIDRLKENYNNVFDERFYLYGVDITFCLRLFDSKLTNEINIISGFDHSLSRLEKEDLKTIKFRRLERSYDFGLQQRYYYPLSSAVFRILKVSGSTIKKMLFRQNYTISLIPVFKGFVLGKHYRSVKK